MRKQTLVIAGLALLSTSAFASKARVEAFGTNANLYIKDSRNIFKNAAAINSNKNYIVTEWGTAAKDDSTTAPRAEGGFFREAGSLAYGLYLGDEGTRNTTRVDTSTATGYLSQDNALDLVLGGDAGVQWGAKLHYANSKNETAVSTAARKNTAFGLGLGMMMGAAEGYVNVDLSDKSTGNGTNAGYQYKLKPSFTVGGSYNWSGYTFFADIDSNKSQTSEALTSTDKNFNVIVGVGRVVDISPTARVFGNAALKLTKNEANNGTATTKTTTNIIPVTFGFETDATSWLVLRGSVGQNVLLNNKKVQTTTTTKSTNNGTTVVNAGGSLTFGKLSLDGSVGVMGTGTLNTDNLLSRVAATYNF